MYKNLSLAVITAVMLFSGGSTWAVGLANEEPCIDLTTTNPPACEDPIQVGSGRYVINVPTDGVMYGTHLCGASCSSLVLPSSPLDPYAVVSYEIIGEIADEVYVRAELENAKFANAETDTILIYWGKDPDPTGTINPSKVEIESIGGSPQKCENNGSECRWILRPQTGSKLEHGDKIYIYYRLTSLVGFDTDGTQVKMTVKLGEQFNPNLMGQDSIVVANAKTPLEAGFEAGTDPSIKISSEDEFKNFTSTTSGGSDELLDATRAVMGYLILKRVDDVMAEDGMTPWYLGETDPTARGATAEVDGLLAGYKIDEQIETMLTITNGQFAASKTDSSGGEVYLEITYPTTLNITANNVTDTEATWHLSDGELSAIVRASDDPSGQNKIPIVIKVDGDNPILTDTGEDALPEATLVIDYVKAESQKDVTIGPTALRRFTADGISCWVYSVPNADAKDIFNLRITNDSTVDGTIRGSLYDKAGTSIFSKQPLLGVDANGDEVELKAGATVRLTAERLVNLPGGPYSWDGRGIMNITSTLSRLEILVLLREKTGASPANRHPLTNISVGAHGVACEN